MRAESQPPSGSGSQGRDSGPSAVTIPYGAGSSSEFRANRSGWERRLLWPYKTLVGST